MALAVATKVSDGQMTVAPGLAPSARCARCRAAVQLVTAKAYLTPTMAANCRSNSAVTGPIESHLERSTSVTAWISSSSRSISANGTFHRLTMACPLLIAVCSLGLCGLGLRSTGLCSTQPDTNVLDAFVVLFESFFVVAVIADVEPIAIKGIA